MVYYIKNGDYFSSIQPYEVADAFNAGQIVYREDLQSVVTDLDEEDLTPRESYGKILGHEETHVHI